MQRQKLKAPTEIWNSKVFQPLAVNYDDPKFYEIGLNTLFSPEPDNKTFHDCRLEVLIAQARQVVETERQSKQERGLRALLHENPDVLDHAALPRSRHGRRAKALPHNCRAQIWNYLKIGRHVARPSDSLSEVQRKIEVKRTQKWQAVVDRSVQQRARAAYENGQSAAAQG